jgi:hypothetical protein
MQITWMEFHDNYNVDVRFTRDTGTEIMGMVTYLQYSANRPAWIAWQEFYAEGDIFKDIRYVLTLPELKAIEQLMNEALKHPDGPNAHTMKLFYEDTL